MPPKRKRSSEEDGVTPAMECRYATYVQGHNAVRENLQRFTEPTLSIDHTMQMLQTIVVDASQAVIHASWLLSLHLHRLCANNNFSVVPNQSFCKTALSLVSQTTGTPGLQQPDLMQTYQETWLPLGFSKPSGAGLTQVFSALGTEMATNYSVHLSESLPKYFATYADTKFWIRHDSHVHDLALARIWRHVQANTILTRLERERIFKGSMLDDYAVPSKRGKGEDASKNWKSDTPVAVTFDERCILNRAENDAAYLVAFRNRKKNDPITLARLDAEDVLERGNGGSFRRLRQ